MIVRQPFHHFKPFAINVFFSGHQLFVMSGDHYIILGHPKANLKKRESLDHCFERVQISFQDHNNYL